MKGRHCGKDRGSNGGAQQTAQWKWKYQIQARKAHPRGRKNGSTWGARFWVEDSGGRDLRKSEMTEIKWGCFEQQMNSKTDRYCEGGTLAGRENEDVWGRGGKIR